VAVNLITAILAMAKAMFAVSPALVLAMAPMGSVLSVVVCVRFAVTAAAEVTATAPCAQAQDYVGNRIYKKARY